MAALQHRDQPRAEKSISLLGVFKVEGAVNRIVKPEYLLVGGGIVAVFGIILASIVGFVLTSMGMSTAREKREGMGAEVAVIGILVVLVIAIAVLACTTH